MSRENDQSPAATEDKATLTTDEEPLFHDSEDARRSGRRRGYLQRVLVGAMQNVFGLASITSDAGVPGPVQVFPRQQRAADVVEKKRIVLVVDVTVGADAYDDGFWQLVLALTVYFGRGVQRMCDFTYLYVYLAIAFLVTDCACLFLLFLFAVTLSPAIDGFHALFAVRLLLSIFSHLAIVVGLLRATENSKKTVFHLAVRRRRR